MNLSKQLAASLYGLLFSNNTCNNMLYSKQGLPWCQIFDLFTELHEDLRVTVHLIWCSVSRWFLQNEKKHG